MGRDTGKNTAFRMILGFHYGPCQAPVQLPRGSRWGRGGSSLAAAVRDAWGHVQWLADAAGPSWWGRPRSLLSTAASFQRLPSCVFFPTPGPSRYFS